MAKVRWTIRDLATNTTWTFPINPNRMDSPFNDKSLEVQPHFWSGRTWKTPTTPKEFTFGGVLLSKSMYDSLEAIMHSKHEQEITDHLGRTFRILPITVEFEDRRSNRYAWKFNYTCRGILTGQYGGGIG